MKDNKYGLALCTQEHLLSDKPITRLEAIILYGISNLTAIISKLRKEGWVIHSQYIPYARALRRLKKTALVVPPQDLPIKSIQLIEYWISR